MRHTRVSWPHLAGLVLSVGSALLFTVLVFLGPVGWASPGQNPQYQDTPTPYQIYMPLVFRNYLAPNHRFGFGTVMNPISAYDPAEIARLRAGIYTSWAVLTAPAHPNGMEYVQLVRLHQKKQWDAYNAPYVIPYTYTLQTSWSLIASAITANPGSLWLIGNEIERIDWPGGRQDEMLPELYAQAYHEIYTFIKQRDPTARVAIGGVIQATPLRFKYLDRVLAAYQSFYGQKMPVDVWNVHGFILREKHYYDGCPDCWGADIPAGLTETVGILYDVDDADDLDTFKQQIIAFRQWMKDKGERDKPLIVTEYGPLMPFFSEERIRDFMYGTFDFMQIATDNQIGYPADNNRLVQQWMWYSLDCDPNRFGGRLFDHETKAITQLGLYWEAYVNDPTRMVTSR